MMQSSFVLAVLSASALATESNYQMPQGAFSYGSGHGSFAAHSGHDHKHGQFHKNPWQHTVVHHKTANDYHKDPWINRNTLNSKDNRRDSWYSPYQQFSPPQIQYKPSVSHAIFASCSFYSDTYTQPEVQFAQMKGKAVIMKRNFCNNGYGFGVTAADVPIYNYIMEYGEDSAQSALDPEAMNNQCRTVGSVFNPLAEVDKFGRANPYQDPNRGTIPPFTSLADNTGFPTCVANMVTAGGHEDLEPINLLQNLEGVEGIMGRTYLATDTQITQKTNNMQDTVNQTQFRCCIIALAESPEGFGPKPVPFPLTTHSSTYNSYGMNYAVPLPYHKHGYQSNADNRSYHHNVGSHHSGLPSHPY